MSGNPLSKGQWMQCVPKRRLAVKSQIGMCKPCEYLCKCCLPAGCLTVRALIALLDVKHWKFVQHPIKLLPHRQHSGIPTTLSQHPRRSHSHSDEDEATEGGR